VDLNILEHLRTMFVLLLASEYKVVHCLSPFPVRVLV
jgi:hypothetical protein